MYKALGEFDGDATYRKLSFREPGRWATPVAASAKSRVAGVPVITTAVTMGDERAGPVLLFLWLAEGVAPPEAPAHGHASDNWRISVRGRLPMGREVYGPGEFRFQEGWKPYASDNYAQGPDGGWSALLFGDRRGMRVRPVKKDTEEHPETNRLLAEWLGIHGDLVSDDPAHAPGRSAMATTMDELRRAAHVNASFEQAATWRPVDGGGHLAAALMGDPEVGPVVLLTRIAPGGRALSSCSFDTEVFRLVVRGEETIDGAMYVAGDMRVQVAGAPIGSVVAGAEGVDEVVVIADRRGVGAGGERWGDEITAVVAELRTQLADGASLASVASHEEASEQQ